MKLPAVSHRVVASLLCSLLLRAPLAQAADAPSTTSNPPVPSAPDALPALRPPLPVSALTVAAVPSAVAIARPSSTEIAQAQAALEKFTGQLDASTQAVLAKYPGILAVRPPRENPLLIPGLATNFRQKHANNVARIAQGPIDLLFMGDSITDWWRDRGRDVFARYWGNLNSANFGIAGDTVQGVLYRLRDGEGEGFRPRAIMLMIGTNNAGSATSAEIAEGIGAIVLDLRTRFPEAKILLLGIFPRADPGSAVRTVVLGANPIIAKLDDGKNVFYLDIGDKFLAADGSLTPEIMPDKLHPTAKGYTIWAEAVKDKLAELMK